MKNYSRLLYLVILINALMLSVSCNSCQSSKNSGSPMQTEQYVKVSPDFNPDSAYSFVAKQVSFGPRIPNTPQHAACGDYLVAKLNDFGAQVIEQKTTVTHYNGQKIPIRNIIGIYQPQKTKRVALFAHWDTRPFADQENDPTRQRQPILGADDGASGVGVLLEIARQLNLKSPNIGIDIIFFDLEDWGPAEFEKNPPAGDWWCMGSQYWAKNPHTTNYRAAFGILLDMVGAPDATFLKEGYSVQYASNVVEKIWQTASKLGYGQWFINRKTGFITDDHVPVNENHVAPTVDIINLKDSGTGFAPYWHTLNDNMSNINRATLEAVGQTVMEVIYSEQ